MIDHHDEVGLHSACTTIKVEYPDVKIYLFGSYVSNPNSAKDIDLLIIYKEINVVDCINLILRRHVRYPVHILSMTSAEESQLNFIKSQEAILYC